MKTGALFSLGKIYHLMSELSACFDKEIVGMDTDHETREKMAQLLLARWTYFHTPLFTASYFLDHEFIAGEGSAEEEQEFRTVLQ